MRITIRTNNNFALLPITNLTSINYSNFGRAILYTATTHWGWCTEAFVSILAQSQSQKSLPGGGGV